MSKSRWPEPDKQSGDPTPSSTPSTSVTSSSPATSPSPSPSTPSSPSTSVTSSASTPPESSELPGSPNGSRVGRLTEGKLPWILAFVCAVLVGALISSAVVELPYFALQPGSVHDSGNVIQVDGEDTHMPNGTINYTTVSIQPVTTLGLISAWLDDDVEIESRREILGDRDADENRELNRFYMDRSQHDAVLVALERLGYDVDVHVGGEVVHEIEPGMPAEGVLEVGDVIAELDGEPIDELDAVQRILADKEVGDEIELLVRPDEGEGEAVERSLTLVESPEGDRAVMGVSILPFEVEYDFPFEISFDTGDVGGPSAGLAFTLSLIDMLTEGDLTGGLDVAVTGAIAPDGEVLPVGGTGQKAAAARKADMDLFLLPASEGDTEKARARAGDVEVIEVATLDEALKALGDRGGDELELRDDLDEAA